MELQVLSFPVFFTSFLFIFMFFKIWKRTNSTLNLPPGPTRLPVIGNMHQLAGALPHRRLRDLALKYGGMMHLQLGQVSNVVISSPDAAKQVMKTHDSVFAQRPSLLAARILTFNLSDIAFAPYTDYWRQLRKICVLELLSAKRVRSFRSIREEEVSNLIAEISTSYCGKLFNLSKKAISLTYNIAARATFGTSKFQDEFVPLVQEITEAAAGFTLSDFYPSVEFLHLISGTKSNLIKLRDEARKVIQNIIDDHRAKKKTGKRDGDKEDEDLVDVLLRVQEDGNLELPLTTENIIAVILDIYIAGIDTSSTTTEWAMSEMIRNPRVMEKAQEEVRRIVGSKGNVEETDLQELNYLKLIIKETLRLHPPAPLLLPRECREKCEINGFDIPEKSKVIVNAWAVGRDPNYWPEAEKFNPERFIGSEIDFKGNDLQYIPFGAGRRMCPGMLFGLANVELPLAQLLYHFDWKIPEGLEAEALDMSEVFGANVRRKKDLKLIPIPYKFQPS